MIEKVRLEYVTFMNETRKLLVKVKIYFSQDDIFYFEYEVTI